MGVKIKIKRDMKELSGKIAVMQHFLNGGKVEYTSIGQNCWADYVEPSWNWALFDYRIKEEPKEYEIVKHTTHDYIHTIKRLSDNEIFTIGDTITGGKIKSIIVENEKIYLEV